MLAFKGKFFVSV